MKHLLIIGARGYGREMYYHARDSHGYGTEFDIKGFLDDKKDALIEFGDEYPSIIDSVEHYEIQKDDVFITALGDVNYKKKYSEIILNKGGEFINLIYKKIILAKSVKIGKGCILCSDVGVSCDVELGDFVTLQRLVTIGHDSKIGSYTHFNFSSFMGGYAEVGDLSTVHPGAIILSHVKVGNNCIIVAGSVVIKKVKDNTTVYGNPAKVLKY